MDSEWEKNFELYKNEPMIINPNIGMPQIVTAHSDNDTFEEKYHININIIANKDQTPENVQEKLQDNLFLVPLYELDFLSRRLKRGERITGSASHIQKTPGLHLQKRNLHQLYDLEKDKKSFLLHYDFFGKDKQILTGQLIFRLESHKSQDWISRHRFLMFDLIQRFSTLSSTTTRTCYHSIVLTSHKWESFRFSHITDIHIAKRFDELVQVLRRRPIAKELERNLKALQLPDITKRYRNPNNHFRLFTKWANRERQKNNLDLVIITGDIIDYYLKNNHNRRETYGLSESNWDIFLRMLLNFPVQFRDDIAPVSIDNQEEISLPIFTITGNHDVRVYGYPLVSLNIYRKFGLTQIEAMLYADPFKTSKIKALTIDRYCLKPYYQFINPFDDYFIKLGNNNFVFLNSGADSFLNFRGLLMGDPASLGFSNKQITFLQNVKEILSQNGEYGNNFLFSHAPAMNPLIRKVWRRKLSQIFKKGPLFDPDRYKEHSLKRIRNDDGRANLFLHFDHGCINRNQLETISYMYRHNMINLAGHTHESDELRINFDPKQTEYYSKSSEIKNNPFAFYWDDYTQLPQYDMDYIRKHRPFVLQTPSLGIERHFRQPKFGGFRIIEIIHNKLKNITLRYLSDLISTA